MNELYHHGVKGQKWGVRRYQNEDGTWTETGKKRRRINTVDVKDYGEKVNRYDDIIIKKGQIINRVVGGNSDKLEDLTKRNKLYGSITKTDNSRYIEFGIEGTLGFKDGGKIYNDEYTANKKIKVAGAKYLVEYTLNKIGNNKISDIVPETDKTKFNEITRKAYDDIKDELINILSEDMNRVMQKPAYSKTSDMYDEILKSERSAIGYRVIRNYFSNTFYKNESVDSSILSDIKKKGYDAIVDMEDVMISDLPLIVLNPSENLTFKDRYEL